MELVDEPAEIVAPLLQAYHDVVQGTRTHSDAWMWLQQLPDANGNVHGCTEGSLVARKEKGSMKQTAASMRNADRRLSP